MDEYPNKTLLKQLGLALEMIFPDLENPGLTRNAKSGLLNYHVHSKKRTETEGVTYRITFEDCTEEVRVNIKNQPIE